MKQSYAWQWMHGGLETTTCVLCVIGVFWGSWLFSSSLSAAPATLSTICKIHVSNPLDSPRSGELVTLNWAQVLQHLPDSKPELVAILDSRTSSPVASQVVDEHGDGSGDKLVFQADFKPHETIPFTLQTQVAPSIKPATHALYTKNTQIDYLAWECDRIAFRLYGPVTEQSLVSSGVDIWCKRVAYPILETMIKRNYHLDNGEGVDCYKTGTGRGCGGTGIWKDGVLHVSRNFTTWKILADGPLQTMIELNYAAWNAGGVQVSEIKRITLNAGSQLCRMDSRFHFMGTDQIEAAAGISLPTGSEVKQMPEARWVSVWQSTDGKDNGKLGLGIVMSPKATAQIKVLPDNLCWLQAVRSDEVLVYYAGAGWSKYGFSSAEDWNNYLARFARNLSEPLRVEWK
jgi:pectinesterase